MSLTATAETVDDAHGRFLSEVIEGLSETQKRLPSKYFYDEAGLALFKAITETPEYYLTRSEMAIIGRKPVPAARRRRCGSATAHWPGVRIRPRRRAAVHQACVSGGRSANWPLR